LDFALEEMMLDKEPKLKKTLIDLYQTSEAYSEVVQVLEELYGRDVKLSILSNGTPEMLFAACAATRIEKLLDFIVSVEEIGIFKPDGRVYELVNTKMGYKVSEVLFVSSNGWDIVGASKFGFSTAWVNRNKKPVERMQWKPNYELSNLTQVIDLFK
jgi:2-haloacid dehalogenase